MKRSKKIGVVLFLIPALVVFCTIYLVPIITVIVSSFTKWNGYDAMQFIGLRNYKEMVGDEAFRAASVNTVKWALLATFVHVPFGVLVALILSKKPFGWKFTRTVYMIPNIISRTALAILFVFIFKPEVGVLNTFIQKIGFKGFSINWLYDPRTAFASVTCIWIFYAAIIMLITMSEIFSIPPSLYEAAKIDGAKNWQVDLYINIPLLKKIIGTGVIIAVTSVFKMFEEIFLTTNGGPGHATKNIAVLMVNSVFNTNRYGYANALAVVLLVMGIVTMVIIQKLFKMDKSAL